MSERFKPSEADESAGSPELGSALREALQPREGMPEATDRMIRAAIRAHFAAEAPGRRRSGRPIRALWAGGSLAAALGLAAAVWWTSRQNPARGPQPVAASAAASAADVDADGAVDMVDALVLAERLREGAAVDAALDVNHDGKVDRGDVDAVARQAVSLNRRASG